MTWYYAEGGRQVGPVDEAALDELVRQGVVRDDTLVWREGLASWQPHGVVRPRPTPPPPPAPAPPPPPRPPAVETRYCAECGRPFPAYELSMVGAAAVCGTCRSVVLQRMSGAPPSPPFLPSGYAQPPAYAQPLVATGAAFDYALWPTRVFAALIDGALVLIAMLVLYFVWGLIFSSLLLSSLNQGPSGLNGMFGATFSSCCCGLASLPLAILLVGLYNKVYLVSKRGFSIGQGLMKIKVIDAQGMLLRQGTAFLRLLVQAGLGLLYIPLLLDLLWPLWDERRQTLHDKAVTSYVVNNPSGT